MDKSILTVTTPKDCVNCALCHRLDLDQFVCQPEGRTIPVKEKPDWCPLRPMPENKRGYMGADNAYEEGYGYGFNACLRALEGEWRQ